jgi:hypothetical protein
MSKEQQSEPARPDGDEAVVVPLRPRRNVPLTVNAASHAPEDLSRYERREDEPDDYRHRMIINVAAFAFTVLLIVAGLWIANRIAEMRKNQDCVLSGKRNCTPIEIPSVDRPG